MIKTPKHDAEELIERFYAVIPEMYGDCTDINLPIQCAIVMVNGHINESVLELRRDHWNDVLAYLKEIK